MNIYVGNLSFEVTDDDLRKEFTAYGEVSSLNIIRDKYTGMSRGFAFVEMPVLSEGQAAIANLNGKTLDDREIRVSSATERSERGSGKGGSSYGNRRGGGSDFRGGPGGKKKRW